MLYHTFLSQINTFVPTTKENIVRFLLSWWWHEQKRQKVLVFSAAAFLVSVPVFFQAPLVRVLPWLSLALTGFWLALGWHWQKQEDKYLWGDLLWGFAWSWLCGSIYWGWLRDYPAIHIPIEAIGLPFAIWGIKRGWGLIGNYFYLGSLIGTAITDLYFYIAGLIPYWQEIMKTDPTLVKPLLEGAIGQVHSVWGISWAILLANILLAISLWGIIKKELHYTAFASAVLTTIVTDGLFLVAAYLGVS